MIEVWDSQADFEAWFEAHVTPAFPEGAPPPAITFDDLNEVIARWRQRTLSAFRDGVRSADQRSDVLKPVGEHVVVDEAGELEDRFRHGRCRRVDDPASTVSPLSPHSAAA